jgi:hypothetical protein
LIREAPEFKAPKALNGIRLLRAVSSPGKEGAMFRVSIAGLLWLVILAALNFAVLRYFELLAQGPEPITLLVGLMPLFDAFLISLYVALNKLYRFTLVRRESRSGFSGSLAITSGVMLAFCVFLSLAAPLEILGLISDLIQSSPWLAELDQRRNGGPLIAAALCVLMSGPLLAIAGVLSFAISRYRLVITRRSPRAPALEDRP